MNLLVDIGNSRIKWACQSNDGLTNFGSSFYRKGEIARLLNESWKDIAAPEKLLVANVAGDLLKDNLHQWATENWNITPEFAAVTRTALGVTNAYSDVERLGIDRWLALIAVWNKYKSSACIIDCGTAVTIDGLNESGEHLGGLILPGLGLMKQSLSQNTMLSNQMKNEEISIMAKNTEQAIDAGCTLAVVGLIEHVLNELQKQMKEKIHCILSGGDSGRIRLLLPADVYHEPYIVLEGLALFATEKK